MLDYLGVRCTIIYVYEKHRRQRHFNDDIDASIRADWIPFYGHRMAI
jgi:hypothetical protein